MPFNVNGGTQIAVKLLLFWSHFYSVSFALRSDSHFSKKELFPSIIVLQK